MHYTKDQIRTHMVDQLLHQQKYKKVMNKLVVIKDKALLKKHLVSFIQEKPRPNVDYFNQCQKLLATTPGNDTPIFRERITILLEDSTKTYDLLDLGV